MSKTVTFEGIGFSKTIAVGMELTRTYRLFVISVISALFCKSVSVILIFLKSDRNHQNRSFRLDGVSVQKWPYSSFPCFTDCLTKMTVLANRHGHRSMLPVVGHVRGLSKQSFP